MIAKLASWGHKIAGFLGERTDYGTESPSESPSPSLNQLKTFFEHYRLESLLPYRGYEPESKLFHNEESVGFVIECHPMVGCTEEMQREISGLFQHTLPEGTHMQFMLWADPKINHLLEDWEAPRREEGDLFSKLAKKRTDFIKSLVFHSEKSTPVRDFRCIVSFSRKGNISTSVERSKILNIREQVVTALKTLGVPVRVLEAGGFINLLSGMLNFNDDTEPSTLEWDPYRSLNEQIPSPGHAIRVDRDELVFDGFCARTYTPQQAPDQWSLHAMGELIGDNLRDMMRVRCPFLLHYGVYITRQDATKTRVQTRENWVEKQAHSKIGKKIPILRNQARELDFVRHQISRGERFVETSFNIILFSPEAEISQHEQVLLNLFRSKRWKIVPEKYLHLQVFLSCLPMNWGEGFPEELRFHQRMKTTLSTESANLLPLQGEWKGTPSPGMIFMGRRGQVFTWSPFDNNSGNYNVCVVGRSGSGKSVFMQELMTSTLGQGGQVFVLDVGRSFEKTVKFLGGEYVEFTPETDICINPFTTIPTDNPQETSDALAMLKPVISLMAAPREGTGDLENAQIEEALIVAWEKRGNEATVTDIADYLNSQNDLIAKNLSKKLYPYTRNGNYGRFFNGKANVNLASRMVVVELEELKERKDLQAVIVQMIIVQITNKLYMGDRKTPSHLVLDEAWDMLRGKQSGEFIETAARRLRKYNGSLVVGTQSVNDFYTTPGAQAAFDNSDWMCLLSQKKESIEQLKKEKRISMDPTMESMLASVQTRQGEYAEVMIYGPHGYAIGRFIPDPYSLVLYSTKAKEFADVQDCIKQGMSMSEAIEEVARKNG